ncbi:MAG: DUF1611 domain-containing protein [Candidatus Melainabacteria bacterium]|nr:DUF1611 domain-containing protein [Candidatus Melainabacteria bacterium]
MITSKNKVIIYAQDSFGGESAKTGIGFIRYGLCETVAIVDKKCVGKKASEVVSGLSPIPIFSSIDDAKKHRTDADILLIGIAPPGGRFPPDWIPDIKKSIKNKLNIVNGLHDFLSSNLEIKVMAEKEEIFIWDVRKTDNKFPIANARLLDYPIQVVLTVGTDAAIGKMTVALELTKSAKKSGKAAQFVATGQTGMMISGAGIPIDAIVGDFMAGAIEEEIIKVAKQNYDYAFVEGQGSILHPGWSGVTLALFHGSLPHKLILCHKAGREYLKNTKVKINSLNDFIKVYETISLPLRQAKVVGIGLNTFGLSEKQAKDAIKIAEDETGLPADDPVKNSGEKLLQACLR